MQPANTRTCLPPDVPVVPLTMIQLSTGILTSKELVSAYLAHLMLTTSVDPRSTPSA